MIEFNKKTKLLIDKMLDKMQSCGGDVKNLKIVVPINDYLLKKYKSKYGYHNIEYSTDLESDKIYVIQK